MSVTCPTCGFDENPDGAEFCEACGSELGAATAATASPPPIPPTKIQTEPESIPTTSPTEPSFPSTSTSPESTPLVSSEPQVEPPPPVEMPSVPSLAGQTARLIVKQAGCPVSEFPLDGSPAIVGRFDPDTGPVEIDLEGFPGDDTISRNHAEIYQEGGQWKIKDLGSVNGVFIKRADQSRFGARITIPEVLNLGDEIAIAKIRFLFQSP
ncbi:MAG: FHA domain-containing protein [Xenococcaceae cyanobacterium]